ncbi:hypothetical protein [Pseudonocardia sp. ICBG601]|uniref:hypothetical protein n=1 Tax=Pseudonocardia sp. ICBG601 TaxID=2846759 RepID=UPI001CF713B8|nr:hypothetical protein [Pseudonocardia sp. ICBG601]
MTLEEVRPTARAAADRWRGLAVFVVRSAAAPLLDEAVAGVARGLEILDVVVLDDAQVARVRGTLPAPASRPVPSGAPYALIVACDVVAPVGTSGVRAVADRVLAVLDYTDKRVLRRVPPRDHYLPVQASSSPEHALALLDALGDPGILHRIAGPVEDLGRRCAMPFPVVRMLGGTSPGFRARVALVHHPVHGPSVCKVFRPGAHEAYGRELRARLELGDLPEVPELLEHGPNWLLTPFYGDTGRHVVRRLPGELAQLRPEVVRTLLRFCRDLHERGRFVLDLSPHNLVWDEGAGLKVLDLEFVLDYPGEPPAWSDCWSLRGVPQAYRASVEGLPDLVLTRGVGNSVFHPAISGMRRARLLAEPRRGEAAHSGATQLAWFSALGTVGRLHPALRGKRH